MRGNPETLTNAAGVVVFEGTTSESGGSQPLVFPIAFDTAGLAAGKVIWTPAVDMWLNDAWFHTTEAWDGTTPFADIGVVADGHGLFWACNSANAAVDVTSPWAPNGDVPSFVQSPNFGSSSQILSVVNDPYNSGGNFGLPLFVAAGTPVAAWVSQDGTPGGADPGAAQGALGVVIDAGAA